MSPFFALADDVRQPAQRDDVDLGIEIQTLVERDPLAGVHLLFNGLQPRIAAVGFID